MVDPSRPSYLKIVDKSHVILRQKEGASDRENFSQGYPQCTVRYYYSIPNATESRLNKWRNAGAYFVGDLMISWARTEMFLPWCLTKMQFTTTTRLNEELTADPTLGFTQLLIHHKGSIFLWLRYFIHSMLRSLGGKSLTTVSHEVCTDTART